MNFPFQCVFSLRLCVGFQQIGTGERRTCQLSWTWHLDLDLDYATYLFPFLCLWSRSALGIFAVALHTFNIRRIPFGCGCGWVCGVCLLTSWWRKGGATRSSSRSSVSCTSCWQRDACEFQFEFEIGNNDNAYFLHGKKRV